MRFFSEPGHAGTARGVLAAPGAAAGLALLAALAVPGAAAPEAGSAGTADGPRESWREVPMPEGFRVEHSELEGPVFADAHGRTLYTWPQHKGRNGYSGEAPGSPECHDEVATVTAGLMSPYPPGIALPDNDTRPSCTDRWRPVYAAAGAAPIGAWSIVERRDGRRQWALDEQPLYTSAFDRRPGDVLGGNPGGFGGDSPAYRVPAAPPPLVPPGFAVRTTNVGRLLTTEANESVYAFDGDTATSTGCSGACLRLWQPVEAPALAHPVGEWTILERSPGVYQWVFRGKPLYTHVLDQHSWSQQGSDVPGWRNVFTQPAPAYPDSFTVQATLAGYVLADSAGRTIYVYRCGEDSAHQLLCDHPQSTQVYRLAMCGGGDPGKCLGYWPYVQARETERSVNRTWRIVSVDPRTGRFTEADDPAALRVWAYRDRPVYTFAGDERPGDVHGDGTGEWRGQRNGLRAFWLRDDFMGREL